MGQNPPHGYVITRVMIWLAILFGHRLMCQSAIEVAPTDQRQSQPEPDFAVLAVDAPEYYGRLPHGHELALVVEVSDRVSRFDLTTKAGLYARAEVPKYWVFDIPRGAIIIHRQPVNGSYLQIERLTLQDSLSIEGASIPVAELLLPERR